MTHHDCSGARLAAAAGHPVAEPAGVTSAQRIAAAHLPALEQYDPRALHGAGRPASPRGPGFTDRGEPPGR